MKRGGSLRPQAETGIDTLLKIRENYTGIVCKVEVVRRWRIRGTNLLINGRANLHEKRAGVDYRYLNYQHVVKVRDKRTTSDGVVKMGCLICLTLNLVFFINNICLCFFRFRTTLVKALVIVGAFP